MGSSKKQTVGYWYPRDMHLGICARVDELVEIRAGGRSAWKGSVTASQRLHVSKRDLWGGEEGEGGIDGDIDVMMGEPDQPINDYLQSRVGGLIPAFRAKLTVLLRGALYGAMNPYLKPIGVRVRNAAQGWRGPVWYPEKAVIPLQSGRVLAMNPAHILYRSFTSLGTARMPAGMLDDASFRAAADYYFEEAFGLCVKFENGESVEKFRSRIAAVIGCDYFQHPGTGLITLAPVTAWYDIDALPILGPEIREFEETPRETSELPNRFVLKWYDPDQWIERVTAPYTLLAGVRNAGRVITETLDYPELAEEALALRVLKRDGDARGKPTRTFRLRVDSSRGTPWMRGEVFRLQRPEDGIADMVCRIVDTDLGTLADGMQTLEVVQDRFALSNASYVAPQPPGPSADTTPVPAGTRALIEIPYALLAAAGAAPETLAADAGFIGVLAARPPVQSANYALATAAGSEAFEERATGDWAFTALVDASIPVDDAAVVLPLTLAQGLHNVSVGDPLLFEDEIVRVDAVDANAGTVTVARGCADTVPVPHTAGARIWGLSDLSSDEREYSLAESVHARVLTRTPGGQLAIDSAPTDTVVMSQRASRPYPPGRLRIADTAGTLTITWTHRDRILQDDQLVDSAQSSIGPEPGTRYALRLLDSIGALLVEKLDIDGVTATVSLAYTGQVTLELYSLTDTGESWQRHVRTFNYTPPSGTTEHTIDAATWTPTVIVIDGGEVTP